ncbi:MAG: sigma 54-interacting transcriptional regulator [bacterium]|nr:sigma 54-interacting transcriptional regulator [bacterium]
MAIQYQCDEVSNILGKSEKIREICRLIGVVAKTKATVLVQGESGTGKELVANAIHAHSLRANKPFIKVNCAALSDTLLESELFGHRKGSFTGAFESRKGRFELADGGTILLDEIGNMSFPGQAKLLRVLQEDEIVPVGVSTPIKVDVRVIATTNVMLKKASENGAFREDLYYRLSVVTIFLPPLRERKEDIPILVNRFIQLDNCRANRKIKKVSNEAMDILVSYNWPGNIRELKNVIENAVIMESTDTIQVSSLPHYLLTENRQKTIPPEHEFNLKMQLKTYERQLILKALNKANWVKTRASKLLGIDQRNLSYFIKKHHILDPEERRRARGSLSSSSSIDSMK